MQARGLHRKHGDHMQYSMLNVEPPPSASRLPHLGAQKTARQTFTTQGRKLEVSRQSYYPMRKAQKTVFVVAQ